MQGELANIQNQYVTQQVQKYDDIWRQGFADMVNNGEDGLKAFGKSLKTTVLTSIADGIYQALIIKKGPEHLDKPDWRHRGHQGQLAPCLAEVVAAVAALAAIC